MDQSDGWGRPTWLTILTRTPGGSNLQTYLIPRFNYLLDLSEEGRPIKLDI